jgi:hypothetical protein
MIIKTLFSDKRIKCIAFLVLLAAISACNGSKTGSDKEIEVQEEELEESFLEDIKSDIQSTKKIFYSVPSPLETAMLLKSAGAQYNDELLNPVSNTANYTTNKKIALNLGIYTTDLSFASLFDQSQATIQYISAAKEMADKLGVLHAIEDSTIKMLEENLNNRDVIMDIISETFMSSSSYLKENDRPAHAAIVLVGGWVEGLYIATNLIEQTTFEGNNLVDRVVDQKLSLDIVLKLLEKHSYHKDVSSLLVKVNEIKEIYDRIEVQPTKNVTVVDEETNVTTVVSEKQLGAMTPEIFEELSKKVKAIRKDFIL